MKKVLFSTFVAAVLLAGTSFAQSQKVISQKPVQNVAAPVATAASVQSQPVEKKETTATTSATTKKESKPATAPAKKAATQVK